MRKEKKSGAQFGKSLKELCYFLTILFCALRACNVIGWAWYWIMSPIFVSWVIGILLLAVAGCAFAALYKENE